MIFIRKLELGRLKLWIKASGMIATPVLIHYRFETKADTTIHDKLQKYRKRLQNRDVKVRQENKLKI